MMTQEKRTKSVRLSKRWKGKTDLEIALELGIDSVREPWLDEVIKAREEEKSKIVCPPVQARKPATAMLKAQALEPA